MAARHESADDNQEETMRRFMVHLVTEVDFEDGDEASKTWRRRTTRSISGRLFRTRPRDYRSGQSRAGSRVSRSLKIKTEL